jgi:hypothetical protein
VGCISASRTTPHASAESVACARIGEIGVAVCPRDPGGPDTTPGVCYGRGTMQNDEAGFRLAVVLFTIAIPIIGAVGAYLAAQMPA